MEEIRLRSLRDRQKEKLHAQPASPTPPPKGPAAEQLRPCAPQERRLRRIARLLGLGLGMFLLGGLGGVWLDRIFLPNLLVEYPVLNQYDLLKKVNERTTVIRETENVNVSSEEGTADAIERVRPAVVSLLRKDASGQDAAIGTGIILTSDGYILTPLKNIVPGAVPAAELQVRFKDGTTASAQTVSQNTDYSLAILKVERGNLPVIPYADSDNLRLGEKLIIVNDAIITDIISRIIQDYAMPGSTSSAPQQRIQTVQDLGQSYAGAAVINVEGKLVGVEQEGNLVIPIGGIREYIATGIVKK